MFFNAVDVYNDKSIFLSGRRLESSELIVVCITLSVLFNMDRITRRASTVPKLQRISFRLV